MSHQVIVSRCLDYRQVDVRRTVDTLLDRLRIPAMVRRGDTVLVKPNMIAPRPAHAAVQTDPMVVAEVARALKDLGARPLVGDSPAWGTVSSCARAAGLDRLLRPLGVDLVRLNRPVRRVLLDGRTHLLVSSVQFEVDLVVNVPKFKAHQQLFFTFAVKNMFGCVPGKTKPIWHLLKGRSAGCFGEFLVRVCQLVNPTVTIVDAIIVMEGQGPINGTPRHMGYLLASLNPFAAELACASLVGVDPRVVPTTAAAERLGLITAAQVTIQGDSPVEVCRNFRTPTMAPVLFTPWRVVCSVGKGIAALLRPSGLRS